MNQLNTVEPSKVPAPKSSDHKGTAQKGPSLSHRFAAVVRWLHIYVSLFAFTSLVFFGITGITLNHPAWFGVEAQTTTEHEGELSDKWLPALPEASEGESPDAEAGVDKLAIAEHLRAAHQLRGAVSEFRVDEYECLILFKGPGYSADVVAQRDTRKYRATVTQMGVVAIMNDLHKGRDTGASWSLVIDIVSLLTVFLSITGLILIFYLKRKRVTGILTTVAGTIVLVAIALWLIP